MSDSTSSPSSSLESVGCVSSLVSLIESKPIQRYNWYNYILSPRMQPIACKVADVLSQHLRQDVIRSLSEDGFSKMVAQVAGVMHWDDDGTELQTLRLQVERLLKQVADSDEKDVTIARLTGTLQAKEDEILRLHESWGTLNEESRDKEAQKRDKEVQLIAAQAEVAALKTQVKQHEATISELHQMLNRLKKQVRRAVPSESVGNSSPEHLELQPLKTDHPGAPVGQRRSTSPAAFGNLSEMSFLQRRLSPTGSDDDIVSSLHQQLAMAEEECRRQAKLTDKYRQLVHSKDQELCAQNKFLDVELQSLQQKHQNQIQVLNEAHELQVNTLMAELEKHRRQMEDMKIRSVSNSTSSGSPAGPPLCQPSAMAPKQVAHQGTSPCASGLTGGDERSKGFCVTPVRGPTRRPSWPTASIPTEESPSAGFAPSDLFETRRSPAHNELLTASIDSATTPNFFRAPSHTNSVAYSLSSLSDSASSHSDAGMQDASTQADLGPSPSKQLRDMLHSMIPDPPAAVKGIRPRRVSGPVIGYRHRPVADPLAGRAPPPPLAMDETTSPRSKLLASMARLPLHKLHESTDKASDSQSQGSQSAPTSARSKAKSSHASSVTENSPLTTPLTPATLSPRRSATSTSANIQWSLGERNKGCRVRSATIGAMPARANASKAPAVRCSIRPRPSSPNTAVSNAGSKSVVIHFPHPLPSPRHDNAAAPVEGGPSTSPVPTASTATFRKSVSRSISQPLSQAEIRAAAGTRRSAC